MPNFIGKILGRGAKETIEAIGNTIDKIDRSDEKMDMQLRYRELLIEMETAYLEYENKLLENQSSIVQLEVKGESWLQRNWRPSLMIMCMYIIFNNYVLVPYFGMPTAVLDDHIWMLIEMGVTGYVAGRSLEKITDKLAPILVNHKKKG